MPLPKDKKIIGSKWIFKVKRILDNTLDKIKSRVIVKGFDQTLRFDFSKDQW